MKHFKKIGVAVGVSAMSISGSGQQSDCTYLLTHPVFKEETLNQQVSARENFRLLQCTSNWRNRQEAQTAGVDVTVPIYRVPVTFGGDFSQAQIDQWKSQNCSNEERKSDYRSTLVRTVYQVDPVVARAFVDCMALATPAALSCSTSETQASVVFEASWRTAVGEKPEAAPVVESLSVMGARCGQTLNAKSRIPQGGVSLLCQLEGDDAPVFVLNTNRGSCVSQGSGMAGSTTLSGRIELNQPTT